MELLFAGGFDAKSPAKVQDTTFVRKTESETAAQTTESAERDEETKKLARSSAERFLPAVVFSSGPSWLQNAWPINKLEPLVQQPCACVRQV